MSEPTDSVVPTLPKLPWWPFLLGDLLLLGLAALLYWQGGHPPFGDQRGLTPAEGVVLAGCVVLGGWIFVTPFLLQYRAWARWAEIGRVDVAVQQIQNIDQVSRLIGSATSSWQAVQVDAARTMQAAQGIAEQMATEARAFTEFMQKANEAERQHLRLEVEKLHRAEADWLQALVRILDHVYALHQAAVRSGQVNLVEQFSQFQRACRDAAQRVGLVPVAARAGEALDPELHQVSKPLPPDLTEPKVGDVVATGYRFQGRLLRKVLVTALPPAGELSISQISQRRAEESAAAQPAPSPGEGVETMSSPSSAPPGAPAQPEPVTAQAPAGEPGPIPGDASQERASSRSAEGDTGSPAARPDEPGETVPPGKEGGD